MYMEALKLLFVKHENDDIKWKDSFCKGEFMEVLSSDLSAFLPTANHEIFKWQADINNTLKFQDDDNRILSYVTTGICSLCLFLQANWTGPEIQWNDQLSYLENEVLNSACSKALQYDGEDIYSLAKFPCLLLIAKTILLDNYHYLKSTYLDAISSHLPQIIMQAVIVWCVRCIQTYQAVLDELSPNLLSIFKELLMQGKELTFNKSLPGDLAPSFLLECAHVRLQYFESEEANVEVENAIKLLKMEINLSAALGKRTRFQQTPMPQLFLDVEIEKSNSTDIKEQDVEHLPKDVTLDNDVLLPSVAYTNEMSKPKHLSIPQQAAILSSCVLCLKKQAKDELLSEELAPYLDYVLQQPKDWCIQSQALFLRSVNEKDKSRKVERSMMQIENLLENRRSPLPKLWHRLQTLHAVNLPATWTVEKAFGQILVSLGSIKSALEVYLRIHAWEEVIACYQVLGRREKAENVIRLQLEFEESPKLWCLLGDVTEDISHYSKAWEISNHRSARAQRSLGLYYLRMKKFAECIPHLTKSVEINSLQPSIWFSLGCSQMLVGDLPLAAKAFQRCVTLNTENAEAWSNLGSILLKLDKRAQSFRAFQEAAHLSYDNSKIWQNLLIVSVDLEEFHEAVRVFDRLLDLKPKEIDTQALKALVYRFENRMDSLDPVITKSLSSKIFKLFGKITSQITSNYTVWRLFSHLYLFDLEQRDGSKALHYMIKSQNCAVQHTNWKHDDDLANEAVAVSCELLRIVSNQASLQEDNSRKILIVSSPLSSVDNFLIQLENHNLVKPESQAENKELKMKIEQLQTQSKELKLILSK